MLQRLVLLRLFLPLVALSVIAIGGVGYLGERTLESRQRQTAQSMAHTVDRYLDQAVRTLDAVARVAEVSPPEDLVTFMQGTWEAYGYFDTLYYLDASSKITLLAPSDPRYQGLDMSNLPYFQQAGEKKDLIISRPFISLRTGNPTVYLIRQLSQGGQVVGELSLGSLQDEITRGKGAPGQDVVFIMDQSGMLLAHPASDLVKQQTNQSYLEIFRRGLGGDATLVYEYAGTMVLGSAARVERAGWVVVVQVPLSVSIRPYVWALGLTLLASLVIWLALTWNLRGQLQRHVVTPLVQLSRGIGALANGDFSRGKALASIPAAFAELTTLVTDFQHMSDTLQARQFALQESEERYRSLFDGVPIGLYRTTPVGQILDINPALVHLLGYPDREALLTLNAVDLYVDPEDRSRWRALIEREGTVHDFHTQYRGWDGTLLWVRDNGRIVQDDQGHVLYYEGSLEDITERRRADAEREHLLAQVQEQARRVQEIMDTVPEGVLLLDANCRVLLANPLGQGYLATLANAQVGGILTRLGDRSLAELLTSPPKGLWHEVAAERRSFQVIARPIEDDPTPKGWVLVIRDVTQQREVEQRIQQQEQLAALGQMAAGIAHDFNNIMAAISLYAGMSLRIADLPSLVYKRLEIVNQQTRRASDLVQQVLDFSRRAVLERGAVDLLTFLKEQIDLLKRTLPENIEVKLVYGKDEYTVNADPTRMQQAVVNLATNARDAMPEGGRLNFGLERIHVRDHASIPLPDMEAGDWVCVTITDTGVGIPPDVLPHIFEPFFTTKAAGRGTGLGLAQVYGIIKQHEGAIDVKTEVGAGTTFVLYLPALVAPQPQPSPSRIEQLPQGHGETVLIVEDDAVARQAVVSGLEALGYRALQATNGLEALAVFEQHADRIELVLSDVVMPEMDGWSLFHALRQRDPAVRVVLLTGYPLEDEEFEDLRALGLREWALKPLSIEQLAQITAQALGDAERK